MDVPTEVLTLTIGHLHSDKDDLKAVRLVCKTFERAATPILFDHITLVPRISVLDTANLVASRFGHQVKTLTLCCLTYPEYSKDEFIRQTEYDHRCLNFESDGIHLDHAFEIYDKARLEQEEVTSSGEYVTRFCDIMSRLPNARKLILNDWGAKNGKDDEKPLPHNLEKVGDLCPFAGCRLSTRTHLRFHVRPESEFSHEVPSPFHLALMALSVTNSPITEIAAISMIGEGPLRASTFIMMPRQTVHFNACFRVLTKLRFSFYMNPKDGVESIAFYDGAIHKALAVAVHLQSLFIEGPHTLYPPGPDNSSKPTWFSACLEGCRFPKLKSLTLMYIDANQHELLDFLEISNRVKHLKLCKFLLSVGLWEELAGKIRNMLQFKSIMLQDFDGWFSNFDIGNDGEKAYA